MPRRARMYLAGLPYHIVQRGNNREACFIEVENYLYYLELLREVSARYGMSLHAYCLMTNHIHLLVTPGTNTTISNTMKVVGSRYAQYINKKYNRTGTLWEGRHKSSLVQSDKYFLICSRYIELNPVAAGMVKSPEEYKWSSYHFNAWGDAGWLTSHEEYNKLGNTREIRCSSYRELFSTHISDVDSVNIRKSVHYCQPTGDDRFKQQVESRYNITLGQMKRGRPRLGVD
ncbi:MAG: transposase [Gammaproteobacteria bacterium]|nr:transposase [Gammaproteobacteria bacterium]